MGIIEFGVKTSKRGSRGVPATKSVPAQLSVERLEDRLAPAVSLASGLLWATGTVRNDRVLVSDTVTADTRIVTINLNGQVFTFPFDQVVRVRVDTYGGNDIVDARRLRYKPTVIFTGDGNDFAFGGQQNDRLYGYDARPRGISENGIDTLVGGRGDDTMHGGDPTRWVLDVIYTGPRDVAALDHTAFRKRDTTDGFALEQPPVIPPTPPAPTLFTINAGGTNTDTASGSQPGERIALGFTLQSAMNAKLYGVTVGGDFGNINDLRVAFGQPGSSDANMTASVTVVSNTDGTKTLRLATPVQLAASPAPVQVRFFLPDGRPVHLVLKSVHVTTEDVLIVNQTQIWWN
jgi:hypothetical protein